MEQETKTEKIVYPGNPSIPGDDYVVEKKVSVSNTDTSLNHHTLKRKNAILESQNQMRKRSKDKTRERTL